MELQMKPIEWAGGEAYELHAEVRRGHESIKIGHAWRVEGAGVDWLIAPGVEFDPASPDAEKFKAATFEEAKAFIAQRTRLLEIPSNRLTAETVFDLTMASCRGLQELAKKTGSMGGYIAGLSAALARTIHENVQEEKQSNVVDSITKEVRESIARLKEADGMVDVLAQALKAALDSHDDDTRPAKPAHH